MAAVIRTMLRGYRYLNEECSDPRTNDWFLMGSPLPGLAILILYLHFVCDLGPNIMAKRKPFNLDRIMQIYNTTQIIANLYLLYKAGFYWLFRYKLVCEPVDVTANPEAVDVAATVWVYFMVKLIDLFDTVFFVLRKKHNQISFLHVYHHAGMVMGSWGAVKYLPGGHITFLGLVNSFVHLIMYGHYLLTSLKWDKPWWKKYITQLQLTQFMILMIHFTGLIVVTDCEFPAWPAFVFIPQNFFMIILFGDFYYKTYIKKPQATPAKKVEQNGSAAIEKTEKIERVEKMENTNGKPKSQ